MNWINLMNKMYSQQGQGFHAVPQDQTFQQVPEVPQVQFSQRAPLLQLLPVKREHKITFTPFSVVYNGSYLSGIYYLYLTKMHCM